MRRRNILARVELKSRSKYRTVLTYGILDLCSRDRRCNYGTLSNARLLLGDGPESDFTYGIDATVPCSVCPVWARQRCRISPPRFLAECRKRLLNQSSFVLLCFALFQSINQSIFFRVA